MTGLDQQVVNIARSWIGTPYVHQASCLAAGTDCLGLVRGVWREIYGFEPEVPPAYSFDWSESSGREELTEAASRWFLPMEKEGHYPGSLIVFRIREGAVAKHLGIAAIRDGTPSFVHSYSGHGVVESFLTPPWQRRIAARFRFPDKG